MQCVLLFNYSTALIHGVFSLHTSIFELYGPSLLENAQKERSRERNNAAQSSERLDDEKGILHDKFAALNYFEF